MALKIEDLPDPVRAIDAERPLSSYGAEIDDLPSGIGTESLQGEDHRFHVAAASPRGGEICDAAFDNADLRVAERRATHEGHEIGDDSLGIIERNSRHAVWCCAMLPDRARTSVQTRRGSVPDALHRIDQASFVRENGLYEVIGWRQSQ